MRRLYLHLFSAFVFTICVCALNLAQAQTPAGKTPPVSVKVTPVAKKTIAPTLKSIASVTPYQTVSVSARVDSQIMDVKFHAGDFVRAGQVLFLLDDRTLKAQLAQAQAALLGDKAQLVNFQAQYERAQLGAQKGFFSQAASDSAKADLEAKKANVAADQALIQNYQAQLAYTVIKAPIDGRAGTIRITVGNTVKANDASPLVVINQVGPIYAQASLPQGSFDALRVAMKAGPAQCFAARNGHIETIEGVVDYIDNAIDQSTGTFVMRAIFDNQDEALWPGMLVNLAVNLGQGDAYLTIPEVAIQHDIAGDFVYVVADMKAQKRKVTVTRMQDGLALIGDGLQENEQVAIDGLMSLKDGAAVAVSPAADKRG